MNIVLLMMAGNGVRFGADKPKQFVEVDGRPVFTYIAEGYNNLPIIDCIIIVTHKDWINYAKDWVNNLSLEKVKTIVQGGDSRSESVKNGLVSAAEIANENDVVLMCDATHPYVDAEGTAKVIEAVKEFGGATLAQFQYDTVYQINPENEFIERVIPRQEVVSGASPEGFKFKEIYDIYNKTEKDELEKMTSAGAIALANGINMKVVKTNTINLKITYPEDFKLFEKMKDVFFEQ